MDEFMDSRRLVKGWAEQVDGDSCDECGYLYTDTEEGCDSCASIKAVVEAAAKFKADENVDLEAVCELVNAYHAVYDIKDASKPGSDQFVQCYNTLRHLADLIVMQGGERPDRYDQPPTKGEQ